MGRRSPRLLAGIRRPTQPRAERPCLTNGSPSSCPRPEACHVHRRHPCTPLDWMWPARRRRGARAEPGGGRIGRQEGELHDGGTAGAPQQGLRRLQRVNFSRLLFSSVFPTVPTAPGRRRGEGGNPRRLPGGQFLTPVFTRATASSAVPSSPRSAKPSSSPSMSFPPWRPPFKPRCRRSPTTRPRSYQLPEPGVGELRNVNSRGVTKRAQP